MLFQLKLAFLSHFILFQLFIVKPRCIFKGLRVFLGWVVWWEKYFANIIGIIIRQMLRHLLELFMRQEIKEKPNFCLENHNGRHSHSPQDALLLT